ncbi:YadA-like family protein [Zymobacter palmae]|nr:YadA-like family protein [Zymobacter palmae]
MHSIALGTVSTADAESAMAYGYSASATGLRSIAMGTPSTTGGVKQDTSNNTQASGQDAIALGTAAKSTGISSIALGESSSSTGNGSVATGQSAKASNNNNSAYGYKASASGDNASAIGSMSTASTGGAQAFGYQANASGANAIASGTKSVASGQAAVAEGYNTQSTGNGTVALGNGAKGVANGAIGIGSDANASANNSTALGYQAAASGVASIAEGSTAKSSGFSSIALGNISTASADNANALGASSSASATYANALGASSNASGAYSFAEGKDSKASGYSSTAIGNASKASDQQAIAMGLAATASGRRSIAIGAPSEESPSSTSTNDSERIASDTTYGTQATSPDATAIGSGAKATSQYATALGTKATASSKNTVAIGKNAAASGTSAIAIGYDAKGLGNYSVTIGEDSTSKGDFSTALGNYASSAGNQSVANGYQASASQSNATALGSNTKASGANSAAIGNLAASSGESSLAAGTSTNASGAKSTALGSSSQATAENATAVGRNTSSSGANALAAGYGASAADQSAIALGDSASAAKENALAVGRGAQASETGSMALGQAATSSETNAIALGNSSAASGDSAVALGNGAKSSSASGVALGEGATASRAGLNSGTEVFSGTAVKSQKGAVSVGSTDNERQIINVAGGTQDTDAVNLRQLRYVGSNLASSLGGGAAFDSSTGAYTAPTYANNNTSFNNVADALKDVNKGALKYDRDSNGKINYMRATLQGDLPNEDDPNHEGSGRGTVIDNLGKGTVSSSSMEAINGSQLHGASSSVANALGGGSTVNSDGTVSNPSYTVHNADGSATTANNVGDALTNVDNRTAGNTDAINNINSGKTGLTQQAAAGEKITVGKDTDGTEVSFADKNSGTRKLTNVTDGDISANSKDAVNGSQLNTERTQRRTADNGLATALGGGAAVADDGTVTAPTYTNNNKSFNNVAEALSDVNSGAVKYERGSDGSINKDKATLEGGSNGTTLDNVANGTVSSSSKQAINGSQLYGTSSSVANALGGGSTVNSDGTVSNPSYTVHNADGSTTTANNVGDALTNVDTRTAGNTDAINNINSGKTGLTQQAAAGEKITVGKDTDGTEVSFADKNNGARKLTNVAAGAISSSSKDAVNGSQLNTERTQRRTADNGLATALGGGAAVADDGTVTAPTYTNNNKSFNNVAEALSDVNSGAVKYERGSDGSINKDKATLEGGSNGTTLDNVANGTVSSSSKQAINGSQLYGTSSSVANALGGGSTVNSDGTVSNPSYTVHNADGSTTTANNVGDAITNVDNRTAGNTDAINNINSGKTGLTQQAAAGEKITVGKDTDGTEVSFADKNNGARKLTNVAAGAISSSSTDAVNGSQLYAGNQSLADALGGGSTLNPDGTVTKPTYANNGTTYNNIGDALKDVNDGAVKYNRNSDGTIDKSKASLEGGDNGTTLDNVAPGTIASDSKQAVNGSQLHSEQTQRQTADTGLANALGGGSKVADDGTVSNPSYTVHNADGSTTTANNVGDALTNVDTRTAGNTDAINNINSGKTGLTQQAAAGEKITVGKDTDGTEVSFADKNSGTRKLTNVTAGAITSTSTDAVNGSQLYAGNQSLANALGGGSTLNPDGTVTKPTYANNGTTYNNIGDALKDVNDGAVKYNRNSDGTIDKSKASLEGGDNGTTLDNVAPGTIASDSKQAVNGSQLHSEQTQRQTADTGLANALGGGSKVADDGTVTNPTYTVHNADGSTTTANNVGDALTNVDTRTAGNTDAINNINSGKTGLTQQAAAGEKITVGKDTDGTEVSFADKNSGTRKLTNVTAGAITSTSTDAVNGSQLYAGNQILANALGGGSTLNPDGTVTKPTYANNGTTYNNIGDALKDVNDGAVKYNRNSDGTIDKSKASLEGGDNGTTLDNVAPGTIASDSKQAVNGSQLHSEQTQRQTADTGLANALGGGSKVADDGTVTNPTYTVHNADGSTTTANNVGDALTNVDTRTAGNTDAINNINSGKTGLTQQAAAGEKITVGKDTDGTEVSFADKNSGTRKLTNVTAGTISSSSTDAVNGSQLHSEQTQRQTADTGLANALGGGSKVADDGTVTSPTYTVHNADGSTTTANNVGDALTNVDTRTAGNTDAINNINSGKTGLTQQAAAGEKITVGKDTDGTEVSFADKNSGTRKLTNVTAGAITSTSTDSVNGSQLYAGNQSIANALGGGSTLTPDGTVTKPTYANNGTTYNNIGDALKDVNDGAVKYNRNSDGTIDKSKASLEGGDNGTTLDNVAPGTIASDSKQAVNGSQLHSEQTQRQTADTGLANALGGGSKVADDGTVTNPTYTVHNADGSTTTANNVGDALTNVDTRTAGNTDAINNINSGKTGLTQQAAAGEKITVGKDTDGTEVSFADKNSGTRKLTNVTAGTISSSSTDAVNGSQLYAGNQSLANALGGGSTLNPDGMVTKPTYANNGTTYNNIGDALKDVNDGAVKYNRNSDGTIDKSKASLEGGDNGTTLDNVAPGTIASGSKQAVNGSQLHSEQTQRQTADTGLANALGGGSKVADDGTVTNPTYTVHNADGSTTTANNVGDALTNVDTRTAGNTDAINNISSGKTGLVQQEAAGKPITVAKDTDGTEVTFADKSGAARKLTNVAAGTISSSSTDAVNGSQLYAGNQSLANALGGGSTLNPDGTVTAPTYSVHGQSYQGVDKALAAVDENAVKYDRNSDGSVNKDKATLGGESNGTTLDNVAPGTIASDSKQAANGSQLHSEQAQRQTADTGLANALGGGSKVADDGTVSNPSYTVHNADGSTTTANNVGDALTNVDTRTAGNTDAINNINSGKTGLTQQAAAGEKITVGKDTDGTEVSFADKNSGTRKLTNVTAGAITSTSTDAVNGSQLYAGNQSIANALGGSSTLNPDGTVTAPSYQLHTYNQHSGEQPAVTYSNVGEALSNVDGRTITNTDQIREIAARVNPAGEYGYSVNGRNFDRVEEAMRDIDAGAVKYNRNADGTINTSKASLEGGDKGTVLDNVANGAVTADSKQAVNGSQLYATNQAISDITGGKTGLTQQAAAGEKITVGKDTDGTEVSFADKNGGTRTLTSVSDGSVSATSKEAVNGSQLHNEQTQRQTADTGLANALGGGASVADNGSVTAPSYTLHNADGSTTTANNVGGALTNLDDRTVNNTNAINQMASGKSGIVQQESNDATITVGKDSNGKAVTFADKNGNARKLMQVANGDINSTSQDAINGSQLHASNMSIANSLGGGSTVNADGTLSVPVYTLNGKQYVGVDQALQGLGQSTASNSDSGSSSATGDHSSATGAGANASGVGATANGDKASATGNGSTAGGANSVASNTNSTALGNGAKATGENASATGAGASAGGKESTATGTNSSAKGDYATASGVNAQASGTGSTASGHGAKASADNSSAFGRDAVASGTGSTAGGNAAKASGDGSTAYGQNATASGSQSAAFGQNATADGQNSVALGAGSSTDGRDNTVSVGSVGSERAISNVADGTQAHDAATVGQMSRGFSAMDHRIDKVERHAKAGTASAMAMTGLPQAVLPGRSMMSAAGGTYEGQSAVAVGLSTMTDNGRWIIKGQVSGNTQGEVGGAVGVGYQW